MRIEFRYTQLLDKRQLDLKRVQKETLIVINSKTYNNMSHYILPMSKVDLQSYQGLKILLAFAERNSLMDEKLDVVVTLLIQSEEKAAAECF